MELGSHGAIGELAGESSSSRSPRDAQAAAEAVDRAEQERGAVRPPLHWVMAMCPHHVATA